METLIPTWYIILTLVTVNPETGMNETEIRDIRVPNCTELSCCELAAANAHEFIQKTGLAAGVKAADMNYTLICEAK